MRQPLGNDLHFGRIVGRNTGLPFPRDMRDKHLYVCGGTGTGKSKFLEHLIRQDIKNWRKSKCGLLLLDPHGNLYDNLIEWLAWNKDVIDAPIIPIDLRQDDWVVSYNILRQRSADPQVLVDNVTDAMAYVWGQAGTNQTPLFARWAGNVLSVLYEKKLTLVEAEHLIDHMAKQLRFAMTADLKDKSSRQDWAFADTLSAKDFEAQIGSTVNRLKRFVKNQTMRSMFGQPTPTVSFDFGRAMEEGSIVLVNLATAGAKISKTNAELFATLLLSDLWTAAQERGKRDGVKPYYCYLDEFQRFVSPTLSENLDEARGFGLHFTMAHQFPNQLRDRGESGVRVYNSVMENASSKVVFRLSHEENLRVMAEWLFRGVMDPDEIKHELYSTKVMQYREEIRQSITRTKNASQGGGAFRGTTGGKSAGGTVENNANQDPNAWNEYDADSEGDSSTWTETEGESVSESTMLIPVFGKELAHVQFRSLEEQIFRAMAVLFDQKERQCVARLVGVSAPVSLYIPDVHKMPASKERTKEYLKRCYDRLPFVLSQAEAAKRLKQKEASFSEEILRQLVDEPASIRSRT